MVDAERTDQDIPKTLADCDQFRRCDPTFYREASVCKACEFTGTTCKTSDPLCGYSRKSTCPCPPGSEPGQTDTSSECVDCMPGKYSNTLSLDICKPCNPQTPESQSCMGMTNEQCICDDSQCRETLQFRNKFFPCPQTIEEFLLIPQISTLFPNALPQNKYDLNMNNLCDCKPLELKDTSSYLITKLNCTSGQKLKRIQEVDIVRYECRECEEDTYQSFELHQQTTCLAKTICSGKHYTLDNDNKTKDNQCETEFSDGNNLVFLTNQTDTVLFEYEQLRTASMERVDCGNIQNAEFLLLPAWELGLIRNLPIVYESIYAKTSYCPFVCNAGFYMNASSMECVACESGKYKTSSGLDNLIQVPDTTNAVLWADGKRSWDGCTECPAGTYQDLTNASSCQSCPAGFFCVTGAVAPSPCGQCERDQYQAAPCMPNSMQNNCQNCKPGCRSTANSVGEAECVCATDTICQNGEIAIDDQCVVCNNTQRLYALACASAYSQLTVVCEPNNAFFDCTPCPDKWPRKVHAAPDFSGTDVDCVYTCNTQRISPPYFFDVDSIDWSAVKNHSHISPDSSCIESTVLNKYECDTQELYFDERRQLISCYEYQCPQWQYLFQGQCICKSGFYKDVSSCVPCPQNQESLSGTLSVDGCFCSSGYAKVPGGSCVPCSVLGTFYDNIPQGIFCPGGVNNNETLIPHVHVAYTTTRAYELQAIVHGGCHRGTDVVICDCPNHTNGLDPHVSLARSRADCRADFAYYFNGDDFVQCENYASLTNHSDVLALSDYDANADTCRKICKKYAILQESLCVCDYSLFRTLYAQECVCMPGYYENEDLCLPCEPGFYCPGAPHGAREFCDVDKTSEPLSKSPTDCYCIEDGFFWDSINSECRKQQFDGFYTAPRCKLTDPNRIFYGLCQKTCYYTNLIISNETSFEVLCTGPDFRPRLQNPPGMQQVKQVNDILDQYAGSYYIYSYNNFQNTVVFLQLQYLMIKVLECPPLTECTLTNMNLFNAIENKNSVSFTAQREKFGYILQDFAWVCQNNEMLVYQGSDDNALKPRSFRCYSVELHHVIQAASSVPSNLYFSGNTYHSLYFDEINSKMAKYNWKRASEHLGWNTVLECLSTKPKTSVVFSESDACFDCTESSAKPALVAVHDHVTFDVPHCHGRETLISRIPSNQYRVETYEADCFLFACLSVLEQKIHTSQICMSKKDVKVVASQATTQLVQKVEMRRLWHMTVLPRWKYKRSQEDEGLNVLMFVCDTQNQLHITKHNENNLNIFFRTSDQHSQFCNETESENVFAQTVDRQKGNLYLYTSKGLWEFEHVDMVQPVGERIDAGTLVSAAFMWPIRIQFGSEMSKFEDDRTSRPRVLRIMQYDAKSYQVAFEDGVGAFDMQELKRALELSKNDINHKLWQTLTHTVIRPVSIRFLNSTHASNSDYLDENNVPSEIYELLLLCTFVSNDTAVHGNVQVLMAPRHDGSNISHARVLEIYTHMGGTGDEFLYYDYDFVPMRAHETYHNILYVQGRVSIIAWEQNSALLTIHSSRFECQSCRAGLILNGITGDCTCPLGTVHICLPCLSDGMCNRDHAVLDVLSTGCKFPHTQSATSVYASHCVPCGVHTNYFCPTPTSTPEKCPLNTPVSYGSAPTYFAASISACTCVNGEQSSHIETVTSNVPHTAHITQKFYSTFCRLCADHSLCGAVLSEANSMIQCPHNTEPKYLVSKGLNNLQEVIMSCSCKPGWRRSGTMWSTTYNLQQLWPPFIYAFSGMWNDSALESLFEKRIHTISIDNCEECHDPYYCVHGTNATCPGNKTRSDRGDRCVCAEGFETQGDTCVKCPTDVICQDGLRVELNSVLRPCESSSHNDVHVFIPPIGCASCPRHHYCPRKSNIHQHHMAVPCPENSTTPSVGHASLSECICNAGFFLQEATCVPCPVNYRCVDNQKIACALGETSQEGAAQCLSICSDLEYYDVNTKECHACDVVQWKQANQQCKCPQGWWFSNSLFDFKAQYVPGLYLWYSNHPLAISRHRSKALFRSYIEQISVEMPNVVPNCYPSFPGTYSQHENMHRPTASGAHFTVVPAFASSLKVWVPCPKQLFVNAAPETHKAFGFEECFQNTGMWKVEASSELLVQLLNFTTPALLRVDTTGNEKGSQLVQHIVNRNTIGLKHYATELSK